MFSSDHSHPQHSECLLTRRKTKTKTCIQKKQRARVMTRTYESHGCSLTPKSRNDHPQKLGHLKNITPRLSTRISFASDRVNSSLDHLFQVSALSIRLRASVKTHIPGPRYTVPRCH